MATLLAHIRIKEGCEEQWEAVMQDLVDNTLEHETEVIRYEYWKGQQPRSYYGLLSFSSKLAFFEHQDADYHRNPALGDVIEDIRLEFVDPVQAASPLPRTENPDLPADTPAGVAEWEDMTPVQTADWWQNRK